MGGTQNVVLVTVKRYGVRVLHDTLGVLGLDCELEIETLVCNQAQPQSSLQFTSDLMDLNRYKLDSTYGAILLLRQTESLGRPGHVIASRGGPRGADIERALRECLSRNPCVPLHAM